MLKTLTTAPVRLSIWNSGAILIQRRMIRGRPGASLNLHWINQSKSETTRQGVHRGSHRKRSAPGLGPGRAHLTFAFKKLYGPFMLFRSFPGFKGSEVLSTTGRQILLSGIEPILT
jgi:hypothetical protein